MAFFTEFNNLYFSMGHKMFSSKTISELNTELFLEHERIGLDCYSGQDPPRANSVNSGKRYLQEYILKINRSINSYYVASYA